MGTPLDDYVALRERVSRQADALSARYADHLRCRRGCSYCCDAITVLPIEREAIRRWLVRHGRPLAELLDATEPRP